MVCMARMSAALRHPLAGYALAIAAAGLTTVVALALVKRSTPVDAQLMVVGVGGGETGNDGVDAAQEVIVAP